MGSVIETRGKGEQGGFLGGGERAGPGRRDFGFRGEKGADAGFVLRGSYLLRRGRRVVSQRWMRSWLLGKMSWREARGVAALGWRSWERLLGFITALAARMFMRFQRSGLTEMGVCQTMRWYYVGE